MCVMSFTDDELNLALLRFSSDNEAVALEGFRVLLAFGKPYLSAFVRGDRLSSEDVDEITCMAMEKLWRARTGFKNEGVPAFKKYLRVLGNNCRVDFLRGRGREEQLDDAEPPQSQEETTDWEWLWQDVQRAAGDIWLGYAHALTLDQRNQRVIAAGAYFLDQATWEEAMTMAGGPLDAKIFKQWVCDPAVVRDLSYRTLNLTGDDLVVHLLKSEPEVDLLDVYQEAVRDKGRWQAAAIFWKYRDGNLYATVRAKVKKLRGEEFDEAELIHLLARCDAELPFLSITEMLCDRLSNDFGPLFEGNGLWKRLVFDLWHLRRAPQGDIEERLGQASIHAGAKHPVNESLLTSWIGNKVLLRELRERLKDMGTFQ